jgi:antirestriction protein ArdC
MFARASAAQKSISSNSWESKKALTNSPTRLIPMMREYTVFNVDQCDGLPDSVTTGKPMRVRNPDKRDDLADQFLRSTLADIREGHGEAYYVPSRDFISMPAFEAFKGADHFYATVFHELSHWTAHKSRLDRDLKNRFGSRNYGAEELIAELGAAFLCAEFGFDGDLRHAGYIANWIELLKADKRAFFTACSPPTTCAAWLSQSPRKGRRDGAVQPQTERTPRAALRHPPADRHQHRSVLRRSRAGDVRQRRQWLVLVATPARLCARWLAYGAVRYELRSLPQCYECFARRRRPLLRKAGP